MVADKAAAQPGDEVGPAGAAHLAVQVQVATERQFQPRRVEQQGDGADDNRGQQVRHHGPDGRRIGARPLRPAEGLPHAARRERPQQPPPVAQFGKPRAAQEGDQIEKDKRGDDGQREKQVVANASGQKEDERPGQHTGQPIQQRGQRQQLAQTGK